MSFINHTYHFHRRCTAQQTFVIFTLIFAGISFDLLTTSTLTTASLKTPRTSLLPVGKSSSNRSIQTKSRHSGTYDPDTRGNNWNLSKGRCWKLFTLAHHSSQFCDWNYYPQVDFSQSNVWIMPEIKLFSRHLYRKLFLSLFSSKNSSSINFWFKHQKHNFFKLLWGALDFKCTNLYQKHYLFLSKYVSSN